MGWVLVVLLVTGTSAPAVTQLAGASDERECRSHAERVVPMLRRDLRTEVRWSCVPAGQH